MEQQGLPLDDKFPVISFLNRVNEIGVKMRPDLFDDSHEFKEVKPGEFVEETINKDSVILDDSHPRLLKRSNTPIKDLEDDDEIHQDINLQQLIRHILHKSESKEEQSITEKFCDLFKYLQRKVKEVLDWIATAGEKLLIKLFANKKQINHIFDDDWKNFGETLLNTPNFIFSDDTKHPEGFLLYEGDQFYIQNGDKKVKVALNELDFKHKHHFKSPKTKEHLKAIVKLAEIKHKKVRAFGSCHSWSPIHNTNGILVDNRKIGTNEKGEHNCVLHEQDKRTDHPKISKKGQLRPTVTCSPGITTGNLELWLWDRKYSLEASTIEDVFTMGGICVTSSHGTGKKFTVSSDLVIALTIVCSNGKVVEISPHECVEVDGDKRSPATWLLEKGGVKLTPEDVWRAAQVNLGAFGIIYDMTILVRPQMYALFVSEAGRWNEYFGQDPSCVKKLSDLNDEWETLEFWHYPLTIDEEDHPSLTKIFTGKVTYCPFVTITKTMTDQLTEEQSKIYNVVEKDMNSKEMIAQLALQSVGSRFASKMWKWANNLYNSKLFSKLGRLIIKYIVVMVGWVGKIRWGKEPVYKDGHLVEKGEIWKIPQWMANHPVLDATAVVEKIPCLDIEWEFNIPSFDTNGLKDTVHAYGHLIRSCVESFKKDEYPVSINCEMRFLRGSCSPMSMQYNHQPLYDSEEGGEKADRGYAAPEIVSNSPNPWWKSFYEKMNKEVTGIGQKDKKFGDHIRVHHAKQYSSLPGMLKYIREIYDDPKFSSYPHTTLNTSFKLWKEVRTRFDVSGAFINTHVDQLFYNLKDTYQKEEGTEIDEGGNVHKKESPCSIL